MKDKLLTVSLVCNAVLLAVLLWTRAEHHLERQDLIRTMVNADEQYLGLLGQSLKAIESPESDGAKVTADTLRKIIAAGDANIELRRRTALGSSITE